MSTISKIGPHLQTQIISYLIESEKKAHRLLTHRTIDEKPMKVRAGLDLGSGLMKLLVVKTDGKKFEILHHERISVRVGRDLEQYGKFTESTMKLAIDTLKILRQTAQRFGAVDIVAITTAAYRKSPNGKELLKEMWKQTETEIHLVSQEDEGLIALRAIEAKTEKESDKVIAWDIGGGSFQISLWDKNKLSVLQGPFGYDRAQKITPPSPSLTKNQIDELTMKLEEEIDQIPKETRDTFAHLIREKVQNGGSVYSTFNIGVGESLKSDFSIGDMRELLINSVDKAYKSSSFTQNMCLIYVLMKKFNIQQASCSDMPAGIALGVIKEY